MRKKQRKIRPLGDSSESIVDAYIKNKKKFNEKGNKKRSKKDLSGGDLYKGVIEEEKDMQIF